MMKEKLKRIEQAMRAYSDELLITAEESEATAGVQAFHARLETANYTVGHSALSLEGAITGLVERIRCADGENTQWVERVTMILDARGIEADPVAVRDEIRRVHGDDLDRMLTDRFINECLKAVEKIS